MAKKRKEPEETYDVTVWNLTNGEIAKKLWRATYEEAEELREYYADEPMYDVVVEER